MSENKQSDWFDLYLQLPTGELEWEGAGPSQHCS